MSIASLLAATTAAALMAGGVSAAPRPFVAIAGAKILYDQNGNGTGQTIPSQNFTSSAYDSAGADDFVVPAGHVWKVGEVDITGLYFNGSSGVSSENVIIYRDRHGRPGKPVAGGTFRNLRGSDNDGSFAIGLTRNVKLRAGIYWVSVVVNGSGFFEWGWETNSVVQNNQARWRNPGGGFGVCRDWGTIDSCFGYTADLMFALKGRDESGGG